MCLYPQRIRNPTPSLQNGFCSYLDVPCGKCPECLQHRQNEWFTRFALERRYWLKQDSRTNVLFLTLTYDEKHFPQTREQSVKDIQAFRKQLNRLFGAYRYYFVQEFGDRFNRVHFHGLVFGLNFDLASSRKMIERCWNRGRCSTDICRSDAAFRYVSKYVTKALNYDEIDKLPWAPYTASSKRPALGALGITPSLRLHLSCVPTSTLMYNGMRMVEPKSWSQRLRLDWGRFKHSVDMRKFHDEHPVFRDSLTIETALRDYEVARRRYLRKKSLTDIKLDLLAYETQKTSQTSLKEFSHLY